MKKTLVMNPRFSKIQVSIIKTTFYLAFLCIHKKRPWIKQSSPNAFLGRFTSIIHTAGGGLLPGECGLFFSGDLGNGGKFGVRILCMEPAYSMSLLSNRCGREGLIGRCDSLMLLREISEGSGGSEGCLSAPSRPTCDILSKADRLGHSSSSSKDAIPMAFCNASISTGVSDCW